MFVVVLQCTPAVLMEAGGKSGGEGRALSTEISRGTNSQLHLAISEERIFQLRISMIKVYNDKPETFAMGLESFSIKS